MPVQLATPNLAEKREDCVPTIFCWTKMGTEAGQSLETILRRKELERQAGNGTFAWGIGNSLGASPAFAKQARPDGAVDILFSPMKSTPKAIDVKPAQLVLWLAYHAPEAGLESLPAHMLITSRGSGASGTEKRSHYALLCERHEEINTKSDPGMIDAKYAKNLVSLNPLGASQVTAMVRYEPAENSSLEKPYPVSFRARMHREGFVRLGMPVPLIGSLLSDYKALCQVYDAEDWLAGVIDLKRKAQAFLAQSQPQSRLFDF
jgi:hypothetical protein